MALILSLVPVT